LWAIESGIDEAIATSAGSKAAARTMQCPLSARLVAVNLEMSLGDPVSIHRHIGFENHN
jgi:hypothetical protein